jgi:hypothetical protein
MSARFTAGALLLVLTAATACSSGGHSSGGGGGAAAQCAAAVRFGGHLYWGRSVADPVPIGARLGGGTVPGCNDGGGPEPSEAVHIRAIRGLDRGTAVAIEGQRNRVYVWGRHTPVPAALR